MKIAIMDIKVSPRIRQEEGEIDELARSIEKMGLIQPIVLSEQYELLSGYRRLQACKKLGWETIEARVVTVGNDELKRIDLEYHENLGRKDLTPEENLAYKNQREQLLQPAPRGWWARFIAFLKKLFFPNKE